MQKLGSGTRLPAAPVRTLALRFNLVVVLLVAMLAAGRGLPGLVQAARADQTHVCTCATGGDQG